MIFVPQRQGPVDISQYRQISHWHFFAIFTGNLNLIHIKLPDHFWLQIYFYLVGASVHTLLLLLVLFSAAILATQILNLVPICTITGLRDAGVERLIIHLVVFQVFIVTSNGFILDPDLVFDRYRFVL